MYKITIKKDNVWQELELSGESIPITLTANDLSQLSDINGSYSQNIKLPLTAQNKAVLGFVDNPQFALVAPYRKYECRLFVDGVEIIGTKLAFIIISCQERYLNTQVAGVSSSFYKSIQDAPMSEALTEREQNWILTDAAIIDKTPQQDVVTYKNLYWSSIQNYVQLQGTRNLPSLYVYNVLQDITTKRGYTLEKDFDFGSEDKAIVPIVNLENLRDGAGLNYTFAFDNLKAYSFEDNQYMYVGRLVPDGSFSNEFWEITTIQLPSQVIEGATVFVPDMQLLPKYNGFLKITKNTSPFVGNSEFIYINGVKTFVSSTGNQIPVTINTPVVLTPSCASSSLVTVAPNTIYSLNFEIIKISSTPLDDKIINLPEAVGFETQLDFFKAMAQAFGFFATFNDEEQIIKLISLNGLCSNLESSNNWSDKYVSKDTITYKFGEYGQDNVVTFSENDKDEVTDTASFTLDNETLDLTKNIVELPFESGYDGSVGNVPIYDSETDKYSKTSPHLLHDIGDNVYRHYKAIDVIANYTDFKNRLLEKAIVITASFILTPFDLYNFDFAKPIYCEQLGGYYYVNKITNFVVGKATKVELVKIK